ncbi:MULTISPECIES: AraC family transcriptional regulator [Hymenobacter]|uniref:AraC family transcriptional regulator, transcriptional activator of pobA n=1 Tax=Hymenobacter mucosus TaxID=1411120 RepID=A0A238ZGH3_9BACT|nr:MULTISPECIES: helix-turn-helix transcriptional regulator [Hymenobacter]SNR82098.1 AraC family transcriptional regulator, transcriptional activator of pobA [Hymenobacter mucosus]
MHKDIAHYNGLYGDDKAQVSHSYIYSQLIAPRSRATNWGLKPHVHDNLYQLFFLEAGKATLDADVEPVELSTPCVVLIPARVVHGFTFSPQVKGRSLTVAEALLDTILQVSPSILIELNSLHVLSAFTEEESFAELLSLERHIHAEMHSHLPERQLALNGYFKLLFVKLFRLLKHKQRQADSSSNRNLHYFHEFQKSVARAAPFEKKIVEYARELNITSVHLNRICQAVKGKSALEIVNANTVRRAHNHLVYTSSSISEIAYTLQFADSSYFTRFFRKHTGLSPLAYRARAYRDQAQADILEE